VLWLGLGIAILTVAVEAAHYGVRESYSVRCACLVVRRVLTVVFRARGALKVTSAPTTVKCVLQTLSSLVDV